MGPGYGPAASSGSASTAAVVVELHGAEQKGRVDRGPVLTENVRGLLPNLVPADVK